eukprot:10980-Pyramimonas_sp.AAC.1
MRCHAVLCVATPCYAMRQVTAYNASQCDAISCHEMIRCSMQWSGILANTDAMLGCSLLRCGRMCDASMSCDLLCKPVSCHAMLCYAL